MSDTLMFKKSNNTDNVVIELENADNVIISTERLQYLELLESSLPKMIEAAIQNYKNNKLTALHQKDKENPDAVNLRVKRYNEKHEEEINIKRREKRRLQKIVDEANKQALIIIDKKINKSLTLSEALTVNFNC